MISVLSNAFCACISSFFYAYGTAADAIIVE